MKIEQLNYHGWENSYCLSNDYVELVILTDVGPRIMHFAKKLDNQNGRNFFKEFAEVLGTTNHRHWVNYGGHRLWHAPEDKERTYMPDNDPVHFETTANSVTVTQIPELVTGVQKQIKVILQPKSVKVVHHVFNKNLWEVELAPWAISMMAQGGSILMPTTQKQEGRLQATHSLNLWEYSDLSDSRWEFGKHCILLHQDSSKETAEKGGVSSASWGAYFRGTEVFLKVYALIDNQNYPDFGSALEAYSHKDFMELETLAPLQKIAPQGVATHVEEWHVFDLEQKPTSPNEAWEMISPLAEEAVNQFDTTF